MDWANYDYDSDFDFGGYDYDDGYGYDDDYDDYDYGYGDYGYSYSLHGSDAENSDVEEVEDPHAAFRLLFEGGGASRVDMVISAQINNNEFAFRSALVRNHYASDVLNSARWVANRARDCLVIVEDFRAHATPGSGDADIAETLARRAYASYSDILAWLEAITVVYREHSNGTGCHVADMGDVRAQLTGITIQDL